MGYFFHIFIKLFVLLLLPICQAQDFNVSFPLTLLKDYGPKSLPKLRWIHFPRVGVTFANTLLRFSCENLDQHVSLNLMEKTIESQPWRNDPTCLDRFIVPMKSNWFSHYPLRIEDSGFAVAMFRNPTDRLASQLRWMRSMLGMVTIYGVAEKDVDDLQQSLNFLPDPSKLNSSHPCAKVKSPNELRLCRYLAAAYYPGMKGCMTKMLIGRQCAERYQLKTADLQEAQRILRDEFAFIGIADKWEESVHVFHGMYGGKMYTDELFAHYRKSSSAVENVRKALTYTYDYFDEELYRTALEVFEKQKQIVRDKIKQTGKNFY